MVQMRFSKNFVDPNFSMSMRKTSLLGFEKIFMKFLYESVFNVNKVDNQMNTTNYANFSYRFITKKFSGKFSAVLISGEADIFAFRISRVLQFCAYRPRSGAQNRPTKFFKNKAMHKIA